MDIALYRRRDESCPFLLSIDTISLNMLAVQIAACVIQACSEYPKDEDQFPQIGIGGILNQHLKWAPHGFINALQSQVEFLHEVVAEKVNARQTSSPTLLLNEKAMRELVARALEAYQEWKTKVVEEGHLKYGEHWGNAGGFNQTDWTDLNAKLLSVMVPA